MYWSSGFMLCEDDLRWCAGSKSSRLPEQEAEGVAQLAVVVADALHEVFAGGYVFAEVDGGDPEADDLGAEALGDVDGVDAVAEGFGDGAALLVERPAAGGDHLVGRGVAHADGGEQRRVEPAAVLVAAFGVEVGGEAEFGFCSRTACQLAPDSNQTSRMSISLRNSLWPQACTSFRRAGAYAASWMYQASAPSFLKSSTMLRVDGCVVERLVAFFAEEDGDGHAPDALAGDAPVGAGGDHVGDALFAPGGIPDYLLDLVEGALAEGGLVPSAVIIGVSMPMNHCSVARTMMGLWQRQQCG